MTDQIKAKGIHYTPLELASFLADVIRDHAIFPRGPIHILDPACGNGSLLEAIVLSFRSHSRQRLILTGYETDADALEITKERLSAFNVRDTQLVEQDFLAVEGVADQQTLFDGNGTKRNKYDIVIANPPYVRTQVLGAKHAQSLARKFGLTGRVDLYHAFTIAMANSLRPGGVLGLLTSNRFLTIRSGETLRQFLRQEFDINAVHDLGDTKLFSAAVLPVVLAATKRSGKLTQNNKPAVFTRVYEAKQNGSPSKECGNILDAIRDGNDQGFITTELGVFELQRGILPPANDNKTVWSLSTPETVGWLKSIQQAQSCTVEDIADIRVGVKTTADKVFVREDWQDLPDELQPESELLHPLITHHEASRWLTCKTPNRRILYPHIQCGKKRAPIDLDMYPRARAYLESNRNILQARKYVVKGGRKWYEIWVPHQPKCWKQTKVVFPDISVKPQFFIEKGQNIVQGDCYWIILKDDVLPDWLYVILAVCNSTLAVKFYDTVFHNKLYSGRRRFMTQYVKQFPLPSIDNKWTIELIKETKKLLKHGVTENKENRLNSLVWKSFGLDLIEE